MIVKRFCQFFNISNVKVYIHKTYTCTISICIIESIRRSTPEGSSVRIDRFVFGSTLNSQKLAEKVKNVKINLRQVILGIKLCQLFQSYSLVASLLYGGEMS